MIYCVHHNDSDGFGAAYAAWRKFGDSAKYLEVAYGPKSEEILKEIPDGSEIYVLDFSYCRALTEETAARCKLTVIDHHKTAASELVGLDYCHIDQSKAGCVLAWEHFFPGEKVPRLLSYCEDRDLWRWALPDSKEVNAALFTKKKTFEEWSYYMDIPGVYALKEEGKAILAYENTLIENAIEHCRIHEFNGYKVPILNSTVAISEIGNRLLEKFPDAPFAVVFQDVWSEKENNWIRKCSLRAKNAFDVAEFCRERGGGGHPNAAAYSEMPPKPFA